MISKIYIPYSRKKIKASHYHKIRYAIRPGMVLLSQTNGEFSNLFIPGFWSHAAIVMDNLQIVEATSNGVHKSDLIDFMMTKDSVCLLEPLFATEEQMIQAMITAQEQIGKPYDYSMNQSDIQKFYCSELVYFCYRQTVNQSPFTLRETFGRLTVTPQDFYNAKKKFKKVWHSDDINA